MATSNLVAGLESKLDSAAWKRLKTLKDSATAFDWDFANVMLHAVDQGKVDEVLSYLEDYFNDETLAYQHPDIRGLFKAEAATRRAFDHVCTVILGLQPNPGA